MLILVLVNVSVFEMIIYYFYPCFFPLDTSYSVYICPFVLSSALSLSIPKEQKCAPRKNNNMFNILHFKKLQLCNSTTVNQFTVGLSDQFKQTI